MKRPLAICAAVGVLALLVMVCMRGCRREGTTGGEQAAGEFPPLFEESPSDAPAEGCVLGREAPLPEEPSPDDPPSFEPSSDFSPSVDLPPKPPPNPPPPKPPPKPPPDPPMEPMSERLRPVVSISVELSAL